LRIGGRILDEKQEYPIRFGIADIVAVTMLIGLHMAILKNLPLRWDSPQSQRYLAQNVIMMVLATVSAVGPAYLAFRSVSEHKIESFRKRILLLIGMDVCVTGGFAACIAMMLFFWTHGSAEQMRIR